MITHPSFGNPHNPRTPDTSERAREMRLAAARARLRSLKGSQVARWGGLKTEIAEAARLVAELES
jgi:hypothetical protein